MKFTLTIEGDSAEARDMRVLRELSSLLNSSTIYTAAPGQPLTATPAPNADDDDDGAPVAPLVPGEVDKNGLPWDERIHAKTHAKISDGSWRQKRGVQESVVKAVEDELRKRLAMSSAPQPVPTAPVPVPQPVVQPPVPVPVAPVAQPPVVPQPVVMPPTTAVPMPVPVAPPAPVAVPVAPPAAPPATAPVVDFAFIMQALQNAINAGKIDADYMAKLSAELGVSDLTTLQNDMAKCWTAYTILDRDGKYVA